MFSFTTYRPAVSQVVVSILTHTCGGQEPRLPTAASGLGTFPKSKTGLEALSTESAFPGGNSSRRAEGSYQLSRPRAWAGLGVLEGWGDAGSHFGQRSEHPGPPGLCCRTSWTGAGRVFRNITPSATSCWKCSSGSPWSLRSWSHTRGTRAHGIPSPKRPKSR